uniref:Uncharacterized protein n=1 Tax=Anguilla anguilla TaxID=7936 RepID=A0A0E9Q3A8_ANGAN
MFVLPIAKRTFPPSGLPPAPRESMLSNVGWTAVYFARCFPHRLILRIAILNSVFSTYGR